MNMVVIIMVPIPTRRRRVLNGQEKRKRLAIGQYSMERTSASSSRGKFYDDI